MLSRLRLWNCICLIVWLALATPTAYATIDPIVNLGFEQNLNGAQDTVDATLLDYGDSQASTSAEYRSTDESFGVLLEPSAGLSLPMSVTQTIFDNDYFDLSVRFKVTNLGDAGTLQGVDENGNDLPHEPHESEKHLLHFEERGAGIEIVLRQIASGDYLEEARFAIDVKYSDGVGGREKPEWATIATADVDEWVDLRLRVDFERRQAAIYANQYPVYVSRFFPDFDHAAMRSSMLTRQVFIGWKPGNNGVKNYPELYDTTILVDQLTMHNDWDPMGDAPYQAALQLFTNNLNSSNYQTTSAELEAALLVVHEFFSQYPTGRYLENRSHVDALRTAYAREKPVFGSESNQSFMGSSPDGRVLWIVLQAIMDFYFVQDELDAVEGVVFHAHNQFPGPVRAGAERLDDQVVSIDADSPREAKPRLQLAQRRPTGYWAAPGEIVQVCVDESVVDLGLQVYVGAHTFDLPRWRLNASRFPRVSNIFELNAPCIDVANPFGGSVNVFVPANAAGGDVAMTLNGVVKAPFYSSRSGRETSDSDWHDMLLNHNVQWMDFESDGFSFTAPVSLAVGYHPGQELVCEDCEWVFSSSGNDQHCTGGLYSEPCDWAENPGDVMAAWDGIWRQLARFNGRTFPRPLSQSLIVDARAPCGTCITYPYVLAYGKDVTSARHTTDAPTNIRKGALNHYTPLHFHEYGHGSAIPTLPGETESNVQMVAVAALTSLGYDLATAFKHSFRTRLDMDGAAMDWMISSEFVDNRLMAGAQKKYQQRGHAKYIDLIEIFGWDKMGEINGVFTQPDDQGRYLRVTNEAFLDAASEKTQVNVLPLLHFWGIHPTDEQVRRHAADYAADTEQDEVLNKLLHYRSLVPLNALTFDAWYDGAVAAGVFTPTSNSSRYKEYQFVVEALHYEGYGYRMLEQIDNLLTNYYPGYSWQVSGGQLEVQDDICSIASENNSAQLVLNLCNTQNDLIDRMEVKILSSSEPVEELLSVTLERDLARNQGMAFHYDDVTQLLNGHEGLTVQVKFWRDGSQLEDFGSCRYTLNTLEESIRLSLQPSDTTHCEVWVDPNANYTPNHNGYDLYDYAIVIQELVAHLNGELTLSEETLVLHRNDILHYLKKYPGVRYVSQNKMVFNSYFEAFEAKYPPLYSESIGSEYDQHVLTQIMVLLQMEVFDHEYTVENLDDLEGLVFETHEHFPGAVSPSASRVSGSVVVDAENLVEQYNPGPIANRIPYPLDIYRPTGYYAAAGEKVEVCLDDQADVARDLIVSVGAFAHQGVGQMTLGEITPSMQGRMKRVMKEYKLDSQCIHVLSPYGGPVYLAVPPNEIGGEVGLTVSNAIAVPQYQLSADGSASHTEAEWRELLAQAEVPWLEMQSQNYRLTLSISMGLSVNERDELLYPPQAVLQRLEAIAATTALVTGRPFPYLMPQVFLVDKKSNMTRGHADAAQQILYGGDKSFPVLTGDYAESMYPFLNELSKRSGQPIKSHESNVHQTVVIAAILNRVYGLSLEQAFENSGNGLIKQLTPSEAVIDWMTSPNFQAGWPRGTCEPISYFDLDVCDEWNRRLSLAAKYTDFVRMFGWERLGAINARFYDPLNVLDNRVYVENKHFLDAMAAELAVNPLPLWQFWGVYPASEEQHARLTALPTSQAMYDRLLEYYALVPENGEAFDTDYGDAIRRVNAERGTYVSDQYDALDLGAVMRARIVAVIAEYFPDRRPQPAQTTRLEVLSACPNVDQETFGYYFVGVVCNAGSETRDIYVEFRDINGEIFETTAELSLSPGQSLKLSHDLLDQAAAQTIHPNHVEVRVVHLGVSGGRSSCGWKKFDPLQSALFDFSIDGKQCVTEGDFTAPPAVPTGVLQAQTVAVQGACSVFDVVDYYDHSIKLCNNSGAVVDKVEMTLFGLTEMQLLQENNLPNGSGSVLYNTSLGDNRADPGNRDTSKLRVDFYQGGTLKKHRERCEAVFDVTDPAAIEISLNNGACTIDVTWAE